MKNRLPEKKPGSLELWERSVLALFQGGLSLGEICEVLGCYNLDLIETLLRNAIRRKP